VVFSTALYRAQELSMRPNALMSAWAEGIAAFSAALAQHQAGIRSRTVITAASSRLERADRAVRALPVAARLRRLQGDIQEGLELAGEVLLWLEGRGAPALMQEAQADLEEQIRIIHAEAIRQGLVPPVAW